MKRWGKPMTAEVRRAALRKSMIRAVAEFHGYSEASLLSSPSQQRARLAYVAGFEAAACLQILGGLLAAW